MQTVWRLIIKKPEVTVPWMQKHGLLPVGWGEIGDVRNLRTRSAITDAIKSRNTQDPDYSGVGDANSRHGTESLYDFCFTVKPGDLIIVSDGKKRLNVWEVTGDYEYIPQSAAILNYRSVRAAKLLDDADPDETWRLAGAKLMNGQINYQTLGRCEKCIDSETDSSAFESSIGAETREECAVRQLGGGFGDPIENAKVEEAAIIAVRAAYEDDGWDVISVEADKCGYDLECRQGSKVKHVEVKGVRGSEKCFIVTANEVKQARTNPNFVLVVVTSALSSKPMLSYYFGSDFCDQFDLAPIQYRAAMRRK